MVNSRALYDWWDVYVRYLADGVEELETVRLGHLPRIGDLVTFHGAELEFDYRVLDVRWNLFPGGAGGVPDYGVPEINLGKCVNRRKINAS